MKAVLLVGGFGTRLRPLTFTMPKPVVEFCNKPMLVFHIEALAKVGVTTIVLALSRCADHNGILQRELQPYESKLNVNIICSFEDEPLNTGGPLALARDILLEDGEPFFVINSDIICDFPYKKMAAFFKSHSAEGIMVVTKVKEPSKYGVILYDSSTGLVDSFIEKPQEFISSSINAGLYIFSPDILRRIELGNVSLEKQVFPEMARDHVLYCLEYDGFWMDVGQPRDYIKGTALYLNWLRETCPSALAKGKNIVGNVLIEKGAKISACAKIGPNVVIGDNVRIDEGACVRNSSLFKDACVGAYSWIDSSIMGWRSSVGKWVRMENTSVLGEDVTIKDELYINGSRILPNKTICETIAEPQIVM